HRRHRSWPPARARASLLLASWWFPGSKWRLTLNAADHACKEQQLWRVLLLRMPAASPGNLPPHALRRLVLLECFAQLKATVPLPQPGGRAEKGSTLEKNSSQMPYSYSHLSDSTTTFQGR